MGSHEHIERMIRALFRRTAQGIRPGLDVTAALLERLGQPHRAYPVIHVAGTNGKGSVCAMAEAVLRAVGFRTGLYTSPHLVRFHERIRLDGVSISDEALGPVLEAVLAAAEALEAEGGRPATFFEISTAAAFECFRRAGVQVAVVETGMGGRWDSTNVVIPVVAAIGEIDWDHMDYLGNELSQIAAEKCGVIKAGHPVVAGLSTPEIETMIREEARRVGARYVAAPDAVTVARLHQDFSGQKIKLSTNERELAPLVLPLLGRHQLGNTALAVAALQTFFDEAGLTLSDEALRGGLSSVYWPARLQVLQEAPPMVLDSAHNPHAARALAQTLKELAGGREVAWVGGMLADKDYRGYAGALRAAGRHAWAVPLEGERALAPERLADAMRDAGWEARVASLDDALTEAEAWAKDRGGLVCVAGSLYLAGEVLRRRSNGRDLFAAAPGRAVA